MSPPSFFPTDSLSDIANALNDLADAPVAELSRPPDPPPARLASATTNSTAHVATRLAAVVAGHPSAAAQGTAASIRSADDGDSGIGMDGRLLSKELAKELALVHGFGVWAEAVLTPVQRFAIAAPLVREIAASVFRFAIAHHIAPAAGGEAVGAAKPAVPFIASFFGALAGTGKDAGAAVAAELANRAAATCHVWPVRADARRHVLRKALAARYGTAAAAPTAALIAGPPLIVFVREKLQNVERIFTDALTSCEPSTGRNRNTTSLREWEDLAAGLCVFQVLEVDDISSLRTRVSKVLKDAVKTRGLSPTLVVVDADPDTTICSGAEVLGAVCESYGARLHVEGPALAILAASAEVMSSLEFDIKSCVAHSHSVILDVGAWFGVNNVAVVSYFNARNAYVASPAQKFPEEMDEDGATRGGDLSVARVMALWWLLQRVRLTEAQQVVNTAAEQSVRLVDKMAVVPHLIEHKTVGVAANVLLSYAGIDADASFRLAVNRAILLKLSLTSSHAGQYGLTFASHQNREWILFSPLLMALRHGIGGLPAAPLSAAEVAGEIVAAARRCEIAKAGASSFLALAKQCEHLEVLVEPPTDTGPLYFGAVRVVPLGLVTPQWRKEAGMAEQVSKYTCALASRLDISVESLFDAVLYDDCLEEQAPFVCVGPRVGVNSGRRRQESNVENGGQNGGEAEGSPDQANGLDDVEPGNLNFEAARERARESAEALCNIASRVVHDLSVVSAEAVSSPDVAVDGVLPGSFVDMEVKPGEPAVGPVSSEDEGEGSADNIPEENDVAGNGATFPHTLENDVLSAMVVDGIGSPLPDAKSASSIEYRNGKKQVPKLARGTSTGGIWERLFGADDDDDDSGWDYDDASTRDGVDHFRP